MFIQDEKHVSIVTVGVNPPLVFRGEGGSTDDARNQAASAALNVLLPSTSQVSSVLVHNYRFLQCVHIAHNAHKSEVRPHLSTASRSALAASP